MYGDDDAMRADRKKWEDSMDRKAKTTQSRIARTIRTRKREKDYMRAREKSRTDGTDEESGERKGEDAM